MEINKIDKELADCRSENCQLKSSLKTVEKERDMWFEYAKVSEKQERIFKDWTGELVARVLRLYPDAMPSMHSDAGKERERHHLTSRT